MSKKPSSTPIIPIVIIVAVILGGLFFLFKPQKEIPVTPASPQQENIPLPSADNAEDSSEESMVNTNPAKSLHTEQPPRLRQAPMQATLTNTCLESTQRLDQFFDYLDDQEYIQQYQFPHGSKEMISGLINTLLESPPVINEQSHTGADIISNAAHIYRTLGTQNLTFLLKIIKNEADITEETCGYFYEWFNLMPMCLNHSYPLRPSLENLYEYAAFFLQTTGGRAYLARREGHLGLLAQYYSILIINQADQQGLNKYKINLAPLVPNLIGEMEQSDALAEKNNYLAALYDLREQLTEVTGHQ